MEDLPFAAVMEGHYKYLAACPGSTGDSTTQPPFLDSQSPPPPLCSPPSRHPSHPRWTYRYQFRVLSQTGPSLSQSIPNFVKAE